MTISINHLSIAAVAAIFIPTLTGATTVTDTADLTGSSVDVVVREFGTPIGSADSVAVTSGTLEVSAVESGGVFTSVDFTGGDFLVQDTSIVLGGLLAGNTLDSTGLGFSILSSSFALTPAGGNVYNVNGTLNLRADAGTAMINPLGAGSDFGAVPQDYAALLTNSSVEITPAGGGEYNYTGTFRFAETELANYFGTYTLGVSSLNTIFLDGTLTPVPEPSAALFGVVTLLMVLGRRRI